MREKRVVPAPTQGPICEGEIIGVVPHRLWKGLVVTHYKKKKQILDGLKPSRNAKKPSGINSRRFFLDGLKPSRI